MFVEQRVQYPFKHRISKPSAKSSGRSASRGAKLPTADRGVCCRQKNINKCGSDYVFLVLIVLRNTGSVTLTSGVVREGGGGGEAVDCSTHEDEADVSLDSVAPNDEVRKRTLGFPANDLGKSSNHAQPRSIAPKALRNMNKGCSS